MGIVNETVSCEIIEASISVVQREAGEIVEPWKIASLETSGYERMSPKDLRKLGRWLITEGKRIGRDYKSNGAPRN